MRASWSSQRLRTTLGWLIAGSALVQILIILEHSQWMNPGIAFPESSFATPRLFNNTFQKRQFCLVHIGKTAGGSVSCLLGGNRLAKDCEASTLTSSSVLKRFATGKIHKSRDRGCYKKRRAPPKVWLFTVRDPLDRIASWFEYEKLNSTHVNEVVGNRPLLFSDCFSSLARLVQVGLERAFDYARNSIPSRTANDSDLVCAKRAYEAVSGRAGFQYHNFYNYAYYRNWVNRIMDGENYTILVLRTEHLSEDWNQLEQLYGNKPMNMVQSRTDYFSLIKRHQSKSTLDSSLVTNLCKALCREIQVYLDILHRAENLTPKQVLNTQSQILKKCPRVLLECRTPTDILKVHDPRTMETPPTFDL